VLYIRPGAEALCRTMKEGGTGTQSEQPRQPQTMPDKYEVGSHNAIGIAGLSEGAAWVLEQGVASLRRRDEHLCRLFLELTDGVDGLTVYGPRDIEHRAGVFSVNVAHLAPQALADRLEREAGICARAGLHCAPLAHRTIGTYPAGTCRLSFGPFTTESHVRLAAEALANIAQSVPAAT
jgi:cysteine desulfurase/selenocysteine lyase